MFGAFDVSTSALSARRVRLDTIASKIANIDSILCPDGNPAPYRRCYPVFQADGAGGVDVKAIQEDSSPFIMKQEPWNKAANAQGFVSYPNVDLSTEYVNALETTRAYEANITAIETTKSMMSATLRVLG